MSVALDQLKVGLARAFAGGSTASVGWPDGSEMTKIRQRIEKVHGGASIEADPRSILSAIAEFRRVGRVEGFRDTKYVCLGVGAVDSEGWCVLADEKLRLGVNQLVEQQPPGYRRLRCFQALLSSYWMFPLNAKSTSPESVEGWRALRSWLRSEYERINKMSDHKPPWFESLTGRIELLSNQPCDQFGQDLLRGDTTRLNQAIESLSIPRDSWVVEEAVLAQMKAGTRLNDEDFKSKLNDLLAIAMGRTGVGILEPLKIKCLACLVSRYARCAIRPEHPFLRDSAITTVGNPWLRRNNWDAWVREDNRPDDQAREMVFGWLKSRLITDFFELLSADGTNDNRRLAYWLRFAPFVEDMWFALGGQASARRGGQFEDFRERAKGRLLDLEGTSPDNNAFVMKIGAYLAVEFGASGNAFFLFKWDGLSSTVMNTLLSGKAREGIFIGDLKHESHELKLRHVDSPVALKSWEQKFDDKLIRLITKNPEKRPACVPELEAMLVEAGVHSNDMRSMGGALWVFTEEKASTLARRLKALGFAHRQGRGWFKE